MIPFTRFLSITNDPNYNADAAQWSYADDPKNNYYLTVIDNKWEVITAYRRCNPMNANGGRLAGLRGDRLLLHGTVTPPSLYHRSNAMNNQSDLFTGVDAPALSTADIQVASTADPTANWMDPDVGADVSAWPMLPIHSKIASLYLQGRNLMAGFHLGIEILSMIPVGFAEERELWENQLRVGVTRSAAGVDTSGLMKPWTRSDPYDTPALTNWYFALLEASGLVAAIPTGLQATPSQSGLPPTAQSTSGLQPPAPASTDPTTDATMDLLHLMTERLMTSSVSTGRSQSRSYDWVETEYLLERVGEQRANGSFTGLGVSSLSPFFQQLITVRGEKANARMHLERYRLTNINNDMTEYSFVWSTQLVKDLKTLSFNGDDASSDYVNRFRGLSIFSLAPVSESKVTDAERLRQTMIQFEATEGNHGPADAANMAKLAATWNTIPGTRQETYAWVEHVWAMTVMMFGEACPANTPLAQLRGSLRRQVNFIGWTEAHWKAFVWSLHVAYRAFMRDVNTHPLDFIASETAAFKRPDRSILPNELLQPAALLAVPLLGAGGAGAGGGVVPPAGGGRKRQADYNAGPPRNQGPNAAPGELSAHLRSMLAIAKNKTSKHLMIKDLFPDQGAADRILGAEYLSLLTPPGQPPCLRQHIYGNCSSRICNRSHQLRIRPSPQLLDAIAGRMQTQLDSIIREYPN
jgi:hypothetical protein